MLLLAAAAISSFSSWFTTSCRDGSNGERQSGQKGWRLCTSRKQSRQPLWPAAAGRGGGGQRQAAGVVRGSARALWHGTCALHLGLRSTNLARHCQQQASCAAAHSPHPAKQRRLKTATAFTSFFARLHGLWRPARCKVGVQKMATCTPALRGLLRCVGPVAAPTHRKAALMAHCSGPARRSTRCTEATLSQPFRRCAGSVSPALMPGRQGRILVCGGCSAVACAGLTAWPQDMTLQQSAAHLPAGEASSSCCQPHRPPFKSSSSDSAGSRCSSCTLQNGASSAWQRRRRRERHTKQL